MGKKLNIDLAFSADTSKAKGQIADLQRLLSNLSTNTTKANSLGLDKELNQALNKAAELKAILSSSMTTGGNLDLGKFSSELKKNNTSLKQYASDLVSLGPQGEQAFVQLARSISAAEVPLRQSNAMLTEFMNTLKNTTRWQISSSILHGFIGSVQSAYGYAEDLNESLNNIRIVTGQNTAQMAEFAKQANKSARSLSTSTTAYTDAALIFYQQGLGDNDVKDRTDSVIKMANVTRDSETDVASYMTAIWNNFAGEKKHLEEYADTITALGAATASSSSEIAGGLEKFAAIGQQIGLSYDYATTALATVVARTRQSEDVVGTAFKTIFARIQGLSLGETLEDGTNLNKYSQALQAVGVNIKDTSGNLKDMDDILDEMGAKWTTLEKDQQAALAQTVAGTRQYNQLVALMDSWQTDFQDNLKVAQNSKGALQGQADIYAESWEAARDRVTAAAEGLYDSLLNDKVFILALKGLEKIIETVENLVDGLGGMAGVITLAGSMLFKYFGPDMAAGIDNMIYNMQISSKKGLENILELRKKSNAELQRTFVDSADNNGGASAANAKAEVYGKEAELQDKLLDKTQTLLQQGKEIDEIEQKKLQILLDENKALGEQAIKIAEIAEKNANASEQKNADIVGRYSTQFTEIPANKDKDLKVELTEAANKEKQYTALAKVYSNVAKAQKAYGNDTGKLVEYLKNLNERVNDTEEDFTLFSGAIGDATKDSSSYQTILDSLAGNLKELGGTTQEAYKNLSLGTDDIQGFLEALAASQQQAGQAGSGVVESVDALLNVGAQTEHVGEVIEDAESKTATFGECMSSLGSFIVNTGMAMSSLIGLGSLWNDEDLSIGEKILGTITTMATVLPMLTEAMSAQNIERIQSLPGKITDMLLTKAKTLELVGETAGTEALNASIIKQIILKTISNLLDLKKLAIILLITAALVILVGVTMALVKAYETQAEAEETANKIAENAKERFQKLTTAFEELKTSIEDYNDSLNAFNELEYGAEGYAEALEKVNTQARELIENNGLYDKWHYGDNGEIIFDKGALEGAETNAESKAQDANIGYNAAELNRLAVQKKGLIEDSLILYDGSGYGDTTTTTSEDTKRTYMSGEDIISALLSLKPEQLGTLQAKGATSLDYDENIDYYDEQGKAVSVYKDQINKLSEQLGMSADEIIILSDVLEEFGDKAPEIIKKFSDIEKEEDYYREQEALAAAQKNHIYDNNAMAQKAYSNLLSQNEDYISVSKKNSKATNDEGLFKGYKGNKDIKKLLAKRDDKWKNYGNYHMLNDKELAQAYAQYVEGWTNEELDKSTYKPGNGKGTLKTKGKETIKLEDKYMRKELELKLLSDMLAKNKTEKGEKVYDDEAIKKTVDIALSSSSNVSNALVTALANFDGEEMSFDWAEISPEDKDEMLKAAQEMGGVYTDAVKAALENYTSDAYYARQEEIQSQNIDEQISTNELDSEVIALQTELIQENTEALQENENAAKQLAVNNMRMNKGMKTLIDNWADWKKALSETDKTTSEYAETISSLRSMMADLTGLTEEMSSNISADFFDSAENMELLEKAANADAEAVAQLGFEVGKNLVNNLEAVYSTTKDGYIEVGDGVLFANIDALDEAMSGLKDKITGYMSKIQESVADGTTGMGESLSTALSDGDMASFVDSLNRMAEYTQMSVQDMQGLLNSMGVEANVGVETIDVETSVPRNTTKFTKSGGSVLGMALGDDKGLSIDSTTSVSGYDTVTEKRQVASISYDGSKPSASINYVGHGGASTSNTAAAASNAGKSSGGSQKNSQEKKKVKDEIDRYHVIKNQLEDLQSDYDKISKAKDRAFGSAKIKLMDQEIAKINELISKNKEYLNEAKKNAENEKNELSAFGASFDENGTIANYEKLIESMVAQYNSAVEEFNTHTSDDEAAKTIFETAEKKYSDFQDLISRYEEDQDLLKDLEATIQDQQNQVYDGLLEKTEYIVDIKLDVDDRDLSYLEFLLEMIEDKSFSAGKAIANLGMQAAKYLEQINNNKSGIAGILMNHGYSEANANALINSGNLESLKNTLSLTEDEVSALDGWIDNLLTINGELRSLREDAWAEVNDEFQEYIDKMDSSIEKINHLKSVTQAYQNIVDIVGKKVLGVSDDLINKMNQAVVKESQDILKASKAEADALKASRDELANINTSKFSEDALKQWKDTLDYMDGEIRSAEEDFTSSWGEALQSAADAWESSIESIIANFGEQIAGMQGSISELQAAYDRAKEVDAEYLDAYEQIYQLSKLTRDINNSIDDTDNIASKQKLKELLEEINEIEASGVELSQYDLEYLQKKFELKQAELALNEAQNAKSNVSMVRGEDGNYSYLYTADESAVENAEQSYEDKLYEMQRLNADYINSLQESIIQAQNDISDALSQIKASDYASYEEYMAACEEITSFYQQKVDYYSQQMGSVMDNNKSLYENDWQSYNEQTGYKIAKDEEYIDSFNETAFSVLTGFNTMEDYQKAFNESIGSAENGTGLLGELGAAYASWKDSVDETMELAGTSTEKFADTVEQETDRVVSDSDKAAQSVVNMGQQMEETFGNVTNAIRTWENKYGSAIDTAIRKNNELVVSYNAMKTAMTEGENTASNNSSGENSSNSGSNGNSGNGTGTGSRGNALAVFSKINNGIYPSGRPYRGSKAQAEGYTEKEYLVAQEAINDVYSKSNGGRGTGKSAEQAIADWASKYGFSTGGYTGEWGGTDGKLAMLHQKELILNASDTSNLLSIIDMVREIANIIDLNAAAASGAYSTLVNTNGVSTGSQDLSQEVTIHAEFPNATNHYEIEEAFNNLINTASQYANRDH